jgi:hypothetical protein
VTATATIAPIEPASDTEDAMSSSAAIAPSVLIHEWITGYRLDPQNRISTIASANGHHLGQYEYVGGEGYWVYEGRHCTHCGALAAYGNRPTGKSQPRFRMALWGSALTSPCPSR